MEPLDHALDELQRSGGDRSVPLVEAAQRFTSELDVAYPDTRHTVDVVPSEDGGDEILLRLTHVDCGHEVLALGIRRPLEADTFEVRVAIPTADGRRQWEPWW
jgi:hypothetical protein